MKTIETILAATDFSPLGNAAVDRAIMLASRTDAKLHIVHVMAKEGTLYNLPGKGDNLHEKLKSGAQKCLDDLVMRSGSDTAKVNAVVLEGSVAEVISRAVDAFSPDLLVIGAHARGAVQQFFLGGTASRILAFTSCPVLVVRKATSTVYARVLAAVDLEPNSNRVIESARVMAGYNPITIVHAWQPAIDSRLHYGTLSTDELEHLAKNDSSKAQTLMAELISKYELNQTKLQTRIIRGHPNPVILDLAQEINADLIVALRHKGSRMEETIMGSIARLLAYHAPCDVLLG